MPGEKGGLKNFDGAKTKVFVGANSKFALLLPKRWWEYGGETPVTHNK